MSRRELCWLTHCKDAGVELVAGDYRIVLCETHRVELERTSHEGYSLADPPLAGGRPVEDWEDLTIATWWPWEPAR